MATARNVFQNPVPDLRVLRQRHTALDELHFGYTRMATLLENIARCSKEGRSARIFVEESTATHLLGEQVRSIALETGRRIGLCSCNELSDALEIARLRLREYTYKKSSMDGILLGLLDVRKLLLQTWQKVLSNLGDLANMAVQQTIIEARDQEMRLVAELARRVGRRELPGSR